ncbi:MAG: DUF3857 domain-containing protein [Saprospiraceae bacterium]|nr:DUF3857 domain-containing protein [Saprospiraceae bacterium]
MKKTKLYIYGISLLLFGQLTLSGQKYQYGKVTTELLKLTLCEIDSNANAMITYKSGDRDIIYHQPDGFKAHLDQKTQIKIFNNEAKDIGNVSFYYYSPKSGAGKVKISGLKGRTYNLQNGKTIETKFNDENVFNVQYSNYFKKVTIAIPNLQKGSVFEFEYSLSSDYYTNIEDWFVQEDIPVLYNEFSVQIPEYFKYQINVVGGIVPIKDAISTSSRSVNFKTTTDNRLTGRSTEFDQFDIQYNSRKLAFTNIAAQEVEPLMVNIEDSRAKVTHQLITVQFPNSVLQTFAGSYDKFNLELLENENFGSRIKDGDFIEKIIATKDTSNLQTLATKTYDYFSKNVKWDGSFHYYTDLNGSKLLKEGKGDIGDINLNYIAALNHLGIITYPVILSTRGNGTLHPVYPDYSDFNYVVALSIINDKLVFSDPTSELPFGILPKRCLNGNGWIVGKKSSGWIDLKNDCIGKQVVQSDIIIKDGKLNYISKINRSGYFAFDDIIYLKENDSITYLKKFIPEGEMALDSIAITDQKQNIIKLRTKFSNVISDDQFLYIKPFIHPPFESNPFKREERKSIIDFPYSLDYKLITIIDIPSEYSYEVPANLNAAMEDKSISLKYSTSYSNGLKKLTIMADFKILRTSYLPSEYQDVKISFETMLNKISEPIILKKI